MTKKARLKKKLDKLCKQLWAEGKKCMVCGKPAQTLHHYVPRSLSKGLRFAKDNLIPICNPCHFAHHTRSDPRIHEVIRQKKGKKWAEWIETERYKPHKDTIGYLKALETRLTELKGE